MEYFPSRGLDKILKNHGPFDNRDGLKILLQICSGMAAAHEEGVIHRDLKPSNILIDSEGYVKIVDFGIASASIGSDITLTSDGAVIGSPAYLAPERASEGIADERSDIYSLGIVAYYMFTGHRPYRGDPLKVVHMHKDGIPTPIDEINPSITPKTAELITRMVEVDPKDRPQTMLDVRKQVAEILRTR
jgi:serine/threonine-protein kinase